MDRLQRCFSIKREGELPIASKFRYGLANFKDEFVFLFSNEGSHRYFLAEDNWEKLPITPIDKHPRACALGNKVYSLSPRSCIIKVLHNPDAPVSSKEMHWQEIKLPEDVPRYNSVLAQLNANEIAIAGGVKETGFHIKDIVTFDTKTCEFKKEAVWNIFLCPDNRSANLCENTIIAIVYKDYSYGLIKYIKGNTSATILDEV